MRPIEAILFDLDDTLLDAGAAWRAGVGQLIRTHVPDGVDAELGLRAWSQAFPRWFDPYLSGEISLEASRTGRIRDWAEQLGIDVPAGAELDWFDSYTLGYRAGWVRFPDVDPMLSDLPRLPVGLITNGHGVQQRQKVASLALEDFFDVILVSSEFGSPKPDPAIFRAAAERLDVDPSGCLMIGDQLDADITGALAAGMRAAWVQRPDGPGASTVPPPELAGRFATVATLVEIPRFLERS